MARVSPVDPETVDDPELDELFAGIAELEGHLPAHYRAELNFPAYLKAALRSTMVLWQEGELTMLEVQHVGIAVSRANECANCTGAFCTVLSRGLGVDEESVRRFAERGRDVVDEDRLRTILDYALLVNDDPGAVTDEDVESLRAVGLADEGIVQLTHLVSDFAAWNRANDALDTEYDYREIWREAASLSEPGSR